MQPDGQAFWLDKASALSLTQQLLQQARAAIESGRWHAGVKLPSVRQLAAELGISKFTVADVYERLSAEGLVQSRAGSGVYVARLNPARQLSEQTQSAPGVQSALAHEVALMRQTLQRETDWLKPAAGWLSPEFLPQQELRAALKEVARQQQSLTDYGPAQGYLPLRQYLCGRLGQLRIDCEPGQLLLTHSASHALDLVLRLLLKPGDKVIVDDPGFYNFQALLRLHHLQLLYLPRCQDGPCLVSLGQLIEQHKPRAYLTNSVLSNPVGTCVSAPKAMAVLNLLAKEQVLLIEDDIYAEFEAVPALRYASLTGLSHGVYLGSLSKTISADLRVGYIAASKPLIASLTDLKQISSTASPVSVERVIHQVLTSRGYHRHLQLLREKLAQIRTDVLAKFRQRGFIAWHEPDAGFALWLQLPAGLSAKTLADTLRYQQIVLAPGGHFSQWPDADQFMRVNITQCQSEKLWLALDQLLATC
jgi:DNA-binding transcriptional MocR family regulator